MCDKNMATNYIYLLQEREFQKTKENIYKVGMTTKLNHERFNQYPKGSILLFQIICKNSKYMETKIIKIYKEIFKQRKDIGNEYFEGSYKSMIDIIYSIIKLEEDEHVDSSETVNEVIDATESVNIDELVIADDEEEQLYQIITYEEWIKYNQVSNIIITKKKGGEGYLRFKNQLWINVYDKNRFDWNKDSMEELSGFIEKNQPFVYRMVMPRNELVSHNEMYNYLYSYKDKLTNEIISDDAYKQLSYAYQINYSAIKNEMYKFINVEYDVGKILQDTINKCYKKICEFYKLEYYEYIVTGCNLNSVQYFSFNALNFTFTSVNELICDKILTGKNCGQRRSLYIKKEPNICIVDNILNSIINDTTKQQYKNLLYNLIVKPDEKQIIFYDYNECLLTAWLKDLLYCISGYNIYANSNEYYDNKKKFKNILKQTTKRCVIIENNINIPIETQINYFCKLGFKYIIVCQSDKSNNMYNIINFRKYLQDNKEALINCIKQENNYEIDNWNWETQHDDSIFYKQTLFLTNFLKWCCVK
jgi:hypothetical protein